MARICFLYMDICDGRVENFPTCSCLLRQSIIYRLSQRKPQMKQETSLTYVGILLHVQTVAFGENFTSRLNYLGVLYT